MINISNCFGEDNTPWLPVRPGRAAAATGAPPRTAAGRPSPGRRAGHILAVTGRILAVTGHILAITGPVLLSWLAALPRRLGDAMFAVSDTEAYWRDWQIMPTRGGLGRRYRDPRFGASAECPQCRGEAS